MRKLVPETAHPAVHLTSIVSKDLREQLLKVPSLLATEDPVYRSTLAALRSNWKFAYVVQWLYNFRSNVRLAAELFDVDNFEEELVGIAYPAPFIGKLKTNLIHVIKGGASRAGIDLFETHVRRLFGYDTPLRGVDPSLEDDDEYTEDTTFETLNVLEKVEILYLLIEFVTALPAFRAQMDKVAPGSHQQIEYRQQAIYTSPGNANEQYYLLDDSRLYVQRVNYPAMNVPKKRKHTTMAPEEYDIEPEVQWQCLTVGIYEFHDYIKKNTGTKNRKLQTALTQCIPQIAEQDLKRRRQILARRKTVQMASLLMHRKRSSRLEEKEKRREEHAAVEAELQAQRERAAAQERLAKRQMLRNGNFLSLRSQPEPGMTRAERALQRRILEDTSNTTVSGYATPDEVATPDEAASPGVTATPDVLATPDASENGPQSSSNILSDEWEFDCVTCGAHGTNYDDSREMTKCEECGKWQHVHCQPTEVQLLIKTVDDYRFVGVECKAGADAVKKGMEINDENVREEEIKKEEINEDVQVENDLDSEIPVIPATIAESETIPSHTLSISSMLTSELPVPESESVPRDSMASLLNPTS
ncbi:hypothetical protein BABINDRAFT_159887 [Babjeviella inositovora NRRL Y-12698]|uniref:Zinc finger PHD-type domain-containing protein n=1 Tax=Babjeviella inositovora NRRL Y-12698 TaxID=984486 RepID=A0A1E3QVD7_9ASCO|nr:uncharacterized protein BABINDRAFT_159887 [Babjeviella inositovora NRRL Y-12698]ODQ81618.1 hypothetical protein BABINDRAFT_159887 [Babjeviella inositovora NRRL Y-12698]